VPAKAPTPDCYPFSDDRRKGSYTQQPAEMQPARDWKSHYWPRHAEARARLATPSPATRSPHPLSQAESITITSISCNSSIRTSSKTVTLGRSTSCPQDKRRAHPL
jgi:hypothetical protein